jgi:hypothetical protein
MRFLVQNSLFGCLLFFCSSVFAQTTFVALQPRFESVKYRASIDVLNKHLSGILIFKTQEDSSIRSVFINEMGVTFFDITFYQGSYKYNFIMESMDKKAVKISLAKDLGMILMRGVYTVESRKFKEKGINDKQVLGCKSNTFTFKLKRKGTVMYCANQHSTEFPLIYNFGKKENPVITIKQSYSAESSMPDSIFVNHHKVNFTISLKQFHATE